MKYTDELKARAVELVIHAQADPDTANGAITRVAGELGLSKEILRVWVRKHKDSGKATPAESVDLEAENRRLRAELAEAKRANEILKRESAFFAAELDRPSKRGAPPACGEIVAFIDDNRHEFGVEPIVRALQGTAARIAVSSYYAFTKRQPSARARRDQALMVVIQDVYEATYSCYGVRKLWKAINREYADEFGPVARCTVERLMRQLGIDGVRRKQKRPKTASARAEECPDDLVEREFAAPAPNCLWVADIVRHKALLNRVEVRDHHHPIAAAVG
ncbi:IS3 family transposase [Brevibacterium aurantiacum]|uniref:IS3 family transposase n=1 Tax=Brevibacterium aurantiacum TaxID=273384 RepID=UPI0021B4918A|nr:IS3 family transposase [Brevibacterium aurantiacum]